MKIPFGKLNNCKKMIMRFSLKILRKKRSMSGIIYKQHIMHGLLDHHFTTPLYQELYRTLFKGEGICARDIVYVDAVMQLEPSKQTMALQYWPIQGS